MTLHVWFCFSCLDFTTYYSTGGAAADADDDNAKSSKSISNRYRETGSAVERNAATIARAQSFRDQEQNQRRELLQKRIEETRRKLQDVSTTSFTLFNKFYREISLEIIFRSQLVKRVFPSNTTCIPSFNLKHMIQW